MPESYQSKFNDLLDAAVLRLRALTDADGQVVFKRVEKRWGEWAVLNYPAAIVQPEESEPLAQDSTNVSEARALHALVKMMNADGDEARGVQRQLWLAAVVEDLFRGQMAWVAGHYHTRLGRTELFVGEHRDTFVCRSVVRPIFLVTEPWT